MCEMWRFLVTNSAAALNTTTELIRQQGRHDDGVPVVIIFLTDGISDDPEQTRMAAENLHSALPQVSMTLYMYEGEHKQTTSTWHWIFH